MDLGMIGVWNLAKLPLDSQKATEHGKIHVLILRSIRLSWWLYWC